MCIYHSHMQVHMHHCYIYMIIYLGIYACICIYTEYKLILVYLSLMHIRV